MSKNSFLGRNWKLLLSIATLVAMAVLVLVIWSEIAETFKNLRSVNLWAISLMLPLLVVNYYGQARIYQRLLEMLGNKIKHSFAMKLSFELNFVNKIFPSGGVSGISYFGVRLRGQDVPAGRATMVQIMRLFLQFTSFEVLLIFGLLFLAIGGHVNNMVILVASSITTLMVVGTLAFMYVVGSERRIHATFGALTKAFNTIMRVFRPGKPDAINMARAQRLVQEMHNSYKTLFKDWRKLRAPFLWALVINMAEVLSVYSVYVAFGAWVNLGAIILAFAVANFAGLISVLPAGAGIYEFLMTAVLTAAGVPLALSLPATVMFRVLSTALQLIPGYYFYHKAVREAGTVRPETAARPG